MSFALHVTFEFLEKYDQNVETVIIIFFYSRYTVWNTYKYAQSKFTWQNLVVNGR